MKAAGFLAQGLKVLLDLLGARAGQRGFDGLIVPCVQGLCYPAGESVIF